MSSPSIHRAAEILDRAAVPVVDAAPRLVTVFLASCTPRTLVAFRQDVEDCRLSRAHPEDGMALLLGHRHA